MRTTFLSLLISAFLTGESTQAYVEFSGGVCSSQGTWLESAKRQTAVISEAVEALRNDPNCKAMMEEVGGGDSIGLLKAAEQRREEPSSGAEDLAERYRALQSLAEPLKATEVLDQRRGEDLSSLRDLQKMTFRALLKETRDSVENLQMQPAVSDGKVKFLSASASMQSYLSQKENVINLANHTMAIGSRILNALPKHKKCLHGQTSASTSILAAVADSAGALISGGELGGIGKFISSMQNYKRDMYYTRALHGAELEKFHIASACLVESTAEAYCDAKDAEQTLNLMQQADYQNKRAAAMRAVFDNRAKDAIASPLAGLLIHTDDMVVVQKWLRRVLFGADAQIGAQGAERNKYVGSYLEFVKTVTTLKSTLNELEQNYYETLTGADRDAKLGEFKRILDDMRGNLTKGGGGNNFFVKSLKSEAHLPFFLLGVDLPPEWATVQGDDAESKFDSLWEQWVESKDDKYGTQDPDKLLATLKNNLYLLIDRAQGGANAVFSTRMVEDPQKILAEAMVGPVSPYQAFLHQRTYYTNLISKLKKSAREIERDSYQRERYQKILGVLPMMEDSVARLNEIIKGLESAKNVVNPGLIEDHVSTQNFPDGKQRTVTRLSPKRQAQEIMKVLYHAASMLVSWDSFFGARLQLALQADLDDTLARKDALTPQQREFFLSVGPEVVNRLSGFYAVSPVMNRLSLDPALALHNENLKSVETLFAKVLFKQIMGINCKLEGATSCTLAKVDYDPTNPEPFSGPNIRTLNEALVKQRNTGSTWGGWLYKARAYFSPPEDGSQSDKRRRAKLCIQALGFESRSQFKEICRGAVMESEFKNAENADRLNANFDELLAKIEGVKANTADANRFDFAKREGVCAFRSFLRRNHVYYIYERSNLGH